MKPLGQKPSTHNYVDCHPQKGFVNWWEKEIKNFENKVAFRQQTKKQIDKELDETKDG